MKIGILTYHRAHNYGAMLQAYALRKVLTDNGYEVQFIDYWPYSHQKQYALVKPFRGATFADKFKNIVADILTLLRRYSRIRKFQSFSYNHLGLSHKIHYPLDRQTITEHFDCIIVGSDQIWRNYINSKIYTGFDPVYFCQTLKINTRCISYAASMGIIDITSEDQKILEQYLQVFRTILVRENSLQEFVKELGFHAEVVVDPTLLLNKNQWNDLLPSYRYKKERYVLYYELIQSAEATAYAKHKANDLGCQLLVMSATIHAIPKKRYVCSASPIEFIHAIRDAEYVIATSFHGTAFSIIFEKQFIVTGLKNNADRVQTLLRNLGIEQHYQEKVKTVEDINYTNVKLLQTKMQQQSFNLLLKAINE